MNYKKKIKNQKISTLSSEVSIIIPGIRQPGTMKKITRSEELHFGDSLMGWDTR